MQLPHIFAQERRALATEHHEDLVQLGMLVANLAALIEGGKTVGPDLQLWLALLQEVSKAIGRVLTAE